MAWFAKPPLAALLAWYRLAWAAPRDAAGKEGRVARSDVEAYDRLSGG
jgi:hypothetical protein